MKLQVLVASLNNDYTLHEKMNISSNAIICNQTNFDNRQRIKYKEFNIDYYNFSNRGVGKNRNNALIRADADICIISDDDIFFYENYSEEIIKIFKSDNTLDVLLFNLDEENSFRYKIEKKTSVKFYNYMRYGAARIAFRRESITKNNIFFNLHFGGGTEYSAGEDTLFLTECIKKKLVIKAYPLTIGKILNERESTWFKGYNYKFFYDKAKLFYYISKRYSFFLIINFILRKKFKEISPLKIFKIMIDSRNEEKNKNLR